MNIQRHPSLIFIAHHEYSPDPYEYSSILSIDYVIPIV